MVEGHSVHRIAVAHRRRLVGKTFKATSPNGRFAAGAKAINGRVFSQIEAVGKNLFARFGGPDHDTSPPVVIHVHFGMSGKWTVHEAHKAPDPTPTTRLRLEGHGLISHLSAMTVQEGGLDMEVCFDPPVALP